MDIVYRNGIQYTSHHDVLTMLARNGGPNKLSSVVLRASPGILSLVRITPMGYLQGSRKVLQSIGLQIIALATRRKAEHGKAEDLTS